MARWKLFRFSEKSIKSELTKYSVNEEHSFRQKILHHIPLIDA